MVVLSYFIIFAEQDNLYNMKIQVTTGKTLREVIKKANTLDIKRVINIMVVEGTFCLIYE